MVVDKIRFVAVHAECPSWRG